MELTEAHKAREGQAEKKDKWSRLVVVELWSCGCDCDCDCDWGVKSGSVTGVR
jgi:hypothetical protein